MAITSFPGTAVCAIIDDIPGEGEFQGTGVIIGPHTILTAAHLLYDADTGASADAVSVYPGFVPSSTDGNPSGALGGFQSIHFVKVPDNGEELSPVGTQSDFAVIDTSVDLSRFGSFALDPGFKSGDVVVNGYPASSGGYQAGAEAVVTRTGGLSDIGTSALPLSPGDSGGPLWDKVDRGGVLKPAVVGTVSTNGEAMKLTEAKVALIRHWIASDQSLYFGGQTAPRGLIPQLAGTVSTAVDAAAVDPKAGFVDAAGPGSAAAQHQAGLAEAMLRAPLGGVAHPGGLAGAAAAAAQPLLHHAPHRHA